MRAQRPLVAMALVFSLAACSREKPWHDPLGAHMAQAIYQPGSPLDLRPGPSPEAGRALLASLPAATYTAAQATAGKQVYDATCAHCHPPGQLDGATFSTSWNNRRLIDFYSLIGNTMPQDRPGSLTDEQYLNVIAYILQRNQVPSGSVKLSSDTLTMKNTRIAVGGAAAATDSGRRQ
jgi:mono/diheme cytochrome c family protein